MFPSILIAMTSAAVAEPDFTLTSSSSTTLTSSEDFLSFSYVFEGLLTDAGGPRTVTQQSTCDLDWIAETFQCNGSLAVNGTLATVSTNISNGLLTTHISNGLLTAEELLVTFDGSNGVHGETTAFDLLGIYDLWDRTEIITLFLEKMASADSDVRFYIDGYCVNCILFW